MTMTTDKAHELAQAGAATRERDTGRPCLNVPIVYPFQQAMTAGDTQLDLVQTVDADADFYWRGWFFHDTGAGYDMLARFSLLNGYYLSNDLYPMAHLPLRACTPEHRISAGGFIRIELTNNAGTDYTAKIYFFGVKRFYLDQLKG